MSSKLKVQQYKLTWLTQPKFLFVVQEFISWIISNNLDYISDLIKETINMNAVLAMITLLTTAWTCKKQRKIRGMGLAV